MDGREWETHYRYTLYYLAYIHGMDRAGCEYGSLGAFIDFDGV